MPKALISPQITKSEAGTTMSEIFSYFKKKCTRAILPMDQVQDLILSILDKNSVILDSKDLALNGQKIDQNSVSSVLKRLANLQVPSYHCGPFLG